jgi:hypothetical protein
MIKRYYILLSIGTFLVLFGCSKKLSPPQYYLFNDKAESNKLRGPVKHVDRIFFDNNNEFVKVVTNLPSRPLTEIFGFRGHEVFNKKGQILEYRSFRDSLHFFNPDTTTNWTSVYFHKKPDNMPDANPVYNAYVLVPGKLKMSETYYSDYTTWTNRERGRITTIDTTYLPYGSRSSWRYYSYELDSIGRIKYRRKRDSYVGDKEPHYSETVRYYYDSINRIVKEHFSFFEMVDGSDRFPNGSASYYFDRPFNALQEMNITYEYNEKNLVSKATVFHFTDEIFHQTYEYDEDNDLVSSKYIVNGVPTVFEYAPIKHRKFNKQGDLIYEKFIRKDGSLMREVWIDYYDYDDYNNWQRLEMFLSNTHEGEPDLIGYQKLDYYTENEIEKGK